MNNTEAEAETVVVPVRVAVGLVFDVEGRVLIGVRTEGRSYAGWWEFPGGKVEAGESAEQTLVRELREELDIEVVKAVPCLSLGHDYAEFRVQLEFFRVCEYRGEARGAEGQRLQWVAIEDLSEIHLLEANKKVVEYLLRCKSEKGAGS